MKTDIWISEKWTKNDKLLQGRQRTGLRLRIDATVDPEIKTTFKELAKWLRERFYFPIRVPVYIKASDRIIARDGDLCVSVFFEPDEYTVEPYIRIATGDYRELVKTRGTLQARIAILLPIFHELTHYYQWINAVKLTEIGKERQAARYANDLMEEYLDDLGLLESL